MRVTDDQLLANIVAHVVKGEAALFLLHDGVEDDLHEHVAELLAQESVVALVDRLHCFISLLNEVLADALVRLHPVPRTAVRRAEDVHNAY